MLKITRVYNQYKTIDTYKVEGITTETNQELIDKCDCSCFDGRVYRHGNGTATVECDID